MAKAKKQWDAAGLVDLIRSKYSDPQRHVVLEQVAMGTGRFAQSWIDAAVFNLWPSDGCTRAAFEVKVARSDFLNELRKPEKNDWARSSFHEFWYVAPVDVIKEQELPEGCGWLKPHGAGLTIVRHAARRADPDMDDTLLAAFMRSLRKGGKRDERALLNQLLEDSREFKEAKAWQDAASKFLSSRGCSPCIRFSDDPLKALCDAANDKAQLAQRDRATSILDSFEDKMLGLVEIMEVVARVGLNARNEAEEHIVSAYGGVEKTVEKKLHAKIKHERGQFGKDRLKKRLAWLESLVFD